MNALLFLAAALALLVAAAHSYLGERYILIRLPAGALTRDRKQDAGV